MRTMITSIGTLVLTACQPALDQNPAGPANMAGDVSNYDTEVISLPVGQRNAVFLRAIRDAGLACQTVTRSERLADTAGKPKWRARCEDGTAHLVQVAPDGTALTVSRVGP